MQDCDPRGPGGLGLAFCVDDFDLFTLACFLGTIHQLPPGSFPVELALVSDPNSQEPVLPLRYQSWLRFRRPDPLIPTA